MPCLTYNSPNTSQKTTSTRRQGKRLFDVKCCQHLLRWIKRCRPGNQCSLTYHKCRFCKRAWCHQHGQYQRIERCNKVLAWGVPSDAHAVVLHFPCVLTSKLVTKARSLFIKLVRQDIPELEYLWTLEFIDYVPHLNMTILCYASDSLKQIVKRCWTEVLERLGTPNARKERCYCVPVNDYVDWLNYIHKTKQVLPAKQCPPRRSDLRWEYSRASKGYRARCQEQRSYAMQVTLESGTEVSREQLKLNHSETDTPLKLNNVCLSPSTSTLTVTKVLATASASVAGTLNMSLATDSEESLTERNSPYGYTGRDRRIRSKGKTREGSSSKARPSQVKAMADGTTGLSGIARQSYQRRVATGETPSQTALARSQSRLDAPRCEGWSSGNTWERLRAF